MQWPCVLYADINTDAKFVLPEEDDVTWFCTSCQLRWPPVSDVPENCGKCVCENYFVEDPNRHI